MKKRELIKVGYKAFNGYVFDEVDCKIYNRIQKKINSYISRKKAIPKKLLNQSHYGFGIITGIINTNHYF